jgi:hypothetical protein
MIPLLVTGAIGLASDAISAYQAHSQSVAITQAANSADFQASLKAAATKLATAAEAQKEKALPADLQAVTQQILQSPDIESMAHANPSATVNLQFNSNGDLYVSQPGGGMRQMMVGPDVRQQLQQLDATMHTAGIPSAQVNGEIASARLPVQVNLAAV